LSEPHDVVIVGSGPAGLTAAVYTARANLRPLVVEGLGAGGQLMLTTDVENYPGFPEGIMGPDLMQRFREQAERFGAEFVTADADRVELSNGSPFTVHVGQDAHTAKSVIVSTGASALMLGLPNEERLLGHGVSTCATCDGFFFREQEIAVVGGGDSAIEEAIFLTKFASSVTIVHRRDELRASKIMQERARANPKIRWELNAVVDEVLGAEAGQVTGVRVRDVDTGELREVAADGLFVAVGHDPTTALFQGILDMDDAGYLVTRDGSTATNVPGVFAAGDVVDHTYRQAVTAAGSGCMAALDAERWLVSAREAAAATAR
jgi:thioredoxin reductase (NADPH)